MPTVTSVSPRGGPKSGGTAVRVNGTGFVPGEGATSFKFGSAEAGHVECLSTSECTMISPASRRKVTLDVRAKSNKRSSAKVEADRFTFE
jgi:hypothetical protein